MQILELLGHGRENAVSSDVLAVQLQTLLFLPLIVANWRRAYICILAQKVWERKLLWDFFIFFGIGGTNPAPFDLLKSPSGIPPPIMYKKCRAEWSTPPEDNKKAPRPYGPGAPLYWLKMAHHAKNNDKRRSQQKQNNQHIKHPLQLYFTQYPALLQ